MATKNPPAGWRQSTDTNKPTIYEAYINRVSLVPGAIPSSTIAEVDYSTGSYTVYTTPLVTGTIGDRTPLYTRSASGGPPKVAPGREAEFNSLTQRGEIQKLDSSIKPRVVQLNSTFGTTKEKEDLANSKLYQSSANTAQKPGDKPPEAPTPPAQPGDQPTPNGGPADLGKPEDINKINIPGRPPRKVYGDYRYPLLCLFNQQFMIITL